MMYLILINMGLKMDLNWYVSRFRTMSFGELGFRLIQALMRRYYKVFFMGWRPKVKLVSLPNSVLQLSPELFKSCDVLETKYPFLGITLDYSLVHDWHLDLMSGGRFPLIYCRDVQTRSDVHGIAKYVWEPNRHQFLVKICMQYAASGDNRFINYFIKHLESWYKENPFLTGVNWYSNIEVNIRLINWFLCWEILDLSSLYKTNDVIKGFVDDCFVPLIYQHCRYSHAFPSKFSSANNHRIAEGVGLFIASGFWNFKESLSWQEEARLVVEAEILNQHTTEGINREETAEYIQFISDFFLIAYVYAEKSKRPLSRNYREMLLKIVSYIDSLTSTRGHIDLYGDADNGRVFVIEDDLIESNNFLSLITSGVIISEEKQNWRPNLNFDLKNRVLFGEEAKEVFERMRPSGKGTRSSVFYQESGHYIFRNCFDNIKETHFHFNAAPLGYLSIAGHGHADALSFGLTVDGCPILIDSGTYSYHTEMEWRNYFKGTLAHNTVRLGKRNQATIGGPVMWRNHYKCKSEFDGLGTDTERVSASHNGYSAIGCEHRRDVTYHRNSDCFEILDCLYAESITSFEVMFHFHPDIELNIIGNLVTVVGGTDVKIIMELPIEGNISVHEGSTDPILGWYSPHFYNKRACKSVIVEGTFVEKLNLTTTIGITRNDNK